MFSDVVLSLAADFYVTLDLGRSNCVTVSVLMSGWGLCNNINTSQYLYCDTFNDRWHTKCFENISRISKIPASRLYIKPLESFLRLSFLCWSSKRVY